MLYALGAIMTDSHDNIRGLGSIMYRSRKESSGILQLPASQTIYTLTHRHLSQEQT